MPQSSIRILVAQINPIVGNLKHNTQLILDIIHQQSASHDLILFPELALTGYPPEDLLFRHHFHDQVELHLKRIQAETADCHVIIGHPQRHHTNCFNAASVFYQGKRLAHYHKQILPNDGVFDEKRYFSPGEKRPCIFTLQGVRFGVCICEDLWQTGPVEQLLQADVQVLLSLNASPFDTSKYAKRVQMLEAISKKGIAIVYANLVGGQDELIFDGQSLTFNNAGQLQTRAKAFESDLHTINLTPAHIQGECIKLLSPEATLYRALILATRDYVHKTGFSDVLIGLSGGIDSALTLAIAVDALGKEHVTAVKMPSRYTHSMSLEDAKSQIETFGIQHYTLSIEPTFNACLETLAPVFSQYSPDKTEENIQARIRGMLLMGLSNKTGKLVLTTSNKSEVAVGYSTLYGDMAGGFNVLKDVYKTQVYKLAHYRNSISMVIPERIITRAPSAELAHNQTDQDSLPPYERLDRLLEAYLEQDASAQDLIKQGFSKHEVAETIARINLNEYKRKQAPVGVKLTPLAFGRDRRFPICNQFEEDFKFK
jgi:NAD+ synthase (glutamine-hydrolysing)